MRDDDPIVYVLGRTALRVITGLSVLAWIVAAAIGIALGIHP